MKSKEEQVELVRIQAELERNLARLYWLYNKKFPLTKIWPLLIEEEKKHEEWLLQIIPKIEDGSIYFFRDEVTVDAINGMITSIKKEYDKADKHIIDLKGAVAVALTFEDSALEKNIFSYFDSQSPFIEKILDDLQEETKKHRIMLAEAVISLKRQLKI